MTRTVCVYNIGVHQFAVFYIIKLKLFCVSEMLKNIRKPLPEDFDEKWNEGCNDDLDILLWHSDCDGRLTPQECRKIYRVLEKMNVEFEENIDYYEDFYKNFVAMLKHCYQRRVIMFFC